MERACARLKSAGLRITQPRLAILAALIGRKEPTSVEQLHADLGSGRCDLVTIYRCMAAFEEIGLVRRSYFFTGRCLYELALDKSERYRLVCKDTRRVDDIDPEMTAELSRALRGVEESLRAKGYTDVSHRVEFQGTPPAARP
jgi:Fur family ferric uptake transcriptional regulator